MEYYLQSKLGKFCWEQKNYNNNKQKKGFFIVDNFHIREYTIHRDVKFNDITKKIVLME